MRRNVAETIAIQALTWLVGNDELLPVFLSATGASSEDLRSGATDATFLGAVLGFVTMDDAWVVEFCDSQGLAYEAPMQARQVLPGGDQMHWT